MDSGAVGEMNCRAGLAHGQIIFLSASTSLILWFGAEWYQEPARERDHLYVNSQCTHSCRIEIALSTLKSQVASYFGLCLFKPIYFLVGANCYRVN